MKIAIPTTNNLLDSHFGHAQTFSFFNIENGAATLLDVLAAPPHQPGVLPKWLVSEKVGAVIAGGIGGAAIDILNRHSIDVITGAPEEAPLALATKYALGDLQSEGSVCSSHAGCDSH